MVLLDTNIVIPILREDIQSLPANVAKLLDESEPPFRLSAISLWEMAIKSRAGKLPMAQHEDDWPDLCELLGLKVLSFLPSHAVRSVHPVPDTRDLFDRALLSICSVERLKLVTTDAKLLDHPLAWHA